MYGNKELIGLVVVCIIIKTRCMSFTEMCSVRIRYMSFTEMCSVRIRYMSFTEMCSLIENFQIYGFLLWPWTL